MNYRVILKILGMLLMLFSLTNLPPLLVSFIYSDGAHWSFFRAAAITLLIGSAIWLPVLNDKRELRTRDGFLVVVLFWLVLGAGGSIPLYLAPNMGLSYTDAFFESFSGLTTTGATVIQGLETLPKSILFYRQMLQWLGGMGIIVLAVAVLPMLGVGGMQLYRAETPGPVKDSKLKPRLAETAKALWVIYLSLTLACAGAYWLGGMNLFDAIGHSFSTVAIGGFSTYDASIGHFDSAIIEMIAVIFMLLSAANYGLHFMAWSSRNPKAYWRDPEYRFFLGIQLALIIVTFAVLWFTATYEPADAARYAIFEAVSIMTTTGFGTADFSAWPLMLPFLLFMSSFVGGCAGSTAGGMKAIRILLLWKQGAREVKNLIHPNGVFQVKVGKKSVNDEIISAVWGFFAVYIVVYAIIFFLLLASGLDFETTWSAVGSALNNLGPGLGDVALHYGDINDFAKWILCLAMLLGRLEIFTLLVLFTPLFWKR